MASFFNNACSLRTGEFYKKNYFGGDFNLLKRNDA